MKTLLFFYITLISILVFSYGAARPSHNWDIIGYTAAILYNDDVRGKELTTKAYSEVESVTDATTFKNLISGNTYRSAVFENSESLEQHMPFYTIRMAYLWLVKGNAFLFSITNAESTYLVSSFFAALCTLVLGLLFQTPSLLFFISFPLILFYSGFIEMATLSTPDSMASFFSLCAWGLISINLPAALAVATILPLIRTDFILITVFLSLRSFLSNHRVVAMASLLTATAVYFFINKLNANYGYLTIFNFTLMNLTPWPATMEISSNPADYLRVYFEGFLNLIKGRHFILLLAYTAYWFRLIRPKKIPNLNHQFFIVIGFIFAHMLLFPAYFERFFSWCFAIAGLQLLKWLYQSKKEVI